VSQPINLVVCLGHLNLILFMGKNCTITSDGVAPTFSFFATLGPEERPIL
jgi:hypothetical protein